jgi:nucleotide-binding universal stress UspA family protein
MLSALEGPFAIPLALAARRRERELQPPVVLAPGRAGPGALDVLVGIDGSPDAVNAAVVAARLFGSRVHRITLAAVVDYDTAIAMREPSGLHPPPFWEEEAARSWLAQATRALGESARIEPRIVLLAGNPADALDRCAREGGSHVIVTGCRGHGVSTFLLGSTASRLAAKTSVPVMLVPTAPLHQPAPEAVAIRSTCDDVAHVRARADGTYVP